MSIASAIDRFRARQADQFTATATIRRETGASTTNPTTGVVSKPSTTVAVDEPCKVLAVDSSGEEVQAAETIVSEIDVRIRFAVGTDVERDDLVDITSSTYNPLDVGRTYRVLAVDRREWQISRTVLAREVLAPMEHPGGS